MDIQEHLHNHLQCANTLLTGLQAELPRNSEQWQRLIAAIAYIRAAQSINQFLPKIETQIEDKTCTPIE